MAWVCDPPMWPTPDVVHAVRGHKGDNGVVIGGAEPPTTTEGERNRMPRMDARQTTMRAAMALMLLLGACASYAPGLSVPYASVDARLIIGARPGESGCAPPSTAPPPVARSVSVGVAPVAVAVDPRSRHVFVLNQFAEPDGRHTLQASVSMLDAGGHRVLRVAPLGPVAVDGATLAVDGRSGAVFVLATRYPSTASVVGASAVLALLDGATGRVRRVVTVAPHAAAVALTVDARRGRMFALTSGPPTGAAAPASTAALSLGEDPGALGPGAVTTLDAGTGAVLRTVAVGLAPASVTVDAGTGRVFAVARGAGYSARPVPEGRAVATDKGAVTTLDAATGAALRRVTVGSTPGPLAVDARAGRVFVVNEGPRYGPGALGPFDPSSVSVLDARTRATLRTTTLPDADRAGGDGDVAVAEGTGRVFVGTSGGLVLLDAASGGVVALSGDLAYRLGGDERGPLIVDERRRRVVLVLPAPTVHGALPEQGTADVLDATSAAPLTERLVDVAPVAVTEDERSGLVYVLNQYDMCPAGREPSSNGSVSVFAINAP